MRKVPYPHPGEILIEEFLKPLGITQYRLAKEIGVPQRRIGEIVAGKRAITTDTGLRLSRFFGMSDGFWIGLQMDYDAAKAKDSLAKTLAKIKPWARGELHPGTPALGTGFSQLRFIAKKGRLPSPARGKGDAPGWAKTRGRIRTRPARPASGSSR